MDEFDAARSPYAGVKVALLTQHGKERVLAPLFRNMLAARIELVAGFDTDTLGTFTRDVPRFGSQLDAARKKARVGMERSGLPVGLASEGSFGPGPFGFGSWNLELVLLVDAARGIEILGRSYAPGQHTHALLDDLDGLTEVAKHAGFPAHGLVLRPESENDPRLRKGLCSWPQLERAFAEARQESSNGKVFVESDLRAHMHPTRMANIGAAARDLLIRARSCCPACNAPGFGVVATVPGLPCRDCGDATDGARAEELGCAFCSHREVRRLATPTFAEPLYCNRCNP